MRRLLIGLALVAPGVAWAQAPVSFGGDVWPVLAARCVECHNADTQEGNLRLDSPEGIRAGGEYGAIVVPGKPDESTMFELITKEHTDPDRMPNKGEPLGDAEIATIKAWIEQGAGFDGWSKELLKAIPQKDTTPVVLPAADTLPRETLTYNKDIRPLLSNYCFACHGPDKGARKAGLRLDIEESAKAALADGTIAIAPGRLDASGVARRLFHPDSGERMPPADQHRQPTDEQRRMIAAWIAQGAKYEPHWSLIPPKKSEPPRVARFDNPIDRFIAARLKQEGLKLSPQAAPEDLVRRLSFDLVGLPPTRAMVEAFRKNPDDEAYAALVEDLLGSPRYGERMATHWLDLVRYADTNGYHSDETRKVWAYRDWVIDAFNSGMPYDAFTREQLAGDLLPGATRSQILASSYNRMNQLSAEGGAQQPEYVAKYAADRVRNVGSVWLGLTLGCAECHDHKFDPISAKDFYSFAAFFADVDEFGVYTTGERWDPIFFLPTPEEQAQLDAFQKTIADKTAAIASADIGAGFDAWVNGLRAGPMPMWRPVRAEEVVSDGGATMLPLDDYSVLASGENPGSDKYTATLQKLAAPVTALRMEVMGDPSLNGGFSRADKGGLETSEFIVERKTRGGEWEPVKIAGVVENFSQGGKGANGLIDGYLYTRWSVRPRKPIDDRVSVVFTLDEPVRAGETLRVIVEMRGLNRRTTIGRFRLSVTDAAQPGFDEDRIGVPVDVAAAIKRDQLFGDTLHRAQAFYRTQAPELSAMRAESVAAQEGVLALEGVMNSTMATRARTEPRTVRILARGNWMDETGPVVEPMVPEVLPDLHAVGERPTRLDLAEWMVAPENPLTARVFVNRLWKLYFGRGLSRVLEDLGAQGEMPTHPELLDWLAVEFQESGWDVKHLIRLMVESETYKQSSLADEKLRERDPGNELYARQARVRLEAEMVRDTALAVGGLLSEKIGGPTVKPYQPVGYWRNANTFGESLEYLPSEGEDQYRRGLYTYWKRSFLHPALLAFDAPTREECTASRPASNTPIQALVLLNDPSYVEAARAFAERIVAEGGAKPKQQVDWAVQEALAREASRKERALLAQLYAEHKAQLSEEEATALITIGQHPVPEGVDPIELAAWTSVARTLMNLPEFVTRF